MTPPIFLGVALYLSGLVFAIASHLAPEWLQRRLAIASIVSFVALTLLGVR